MGMGGKTGFSHRVESWHKVCVVKIATKTVGQLSTSPAELPSQKTEKETEEIVLEIIGVIGLVLAIACLIFLSYRGVNAFIASLIASLVVIITNALPFWGTFAGGYATGFKNFAGSYFMLFGLAAAYGEFLKVTGSAESVAKVLFKIFGTKWAPLGALLITLLMAMGGVSAFVIVPQSQYYQEPAARHCAVRLRDAVPVPARQPHLHQRPAGP